MCSLRVRRIGLVATLTWCASCAAFVQGGELPAEDPAPSGRQSNFLVGLRSFEDDGFGRLDDQIYFGLDYCAPIGPEPVRLEGGVHYSFDTANDALASGEGVELEAETLELSAGFRAVFSASPRCS